VIFTGWVGADEINWFRARAAVGFQPYVAGAPQGLANKLFEYLSAGMPVVSSLAGENQELIARYDCGLTYRAADGADCWHQLSQLLADAGRRQRMGASGKRLFEQHFNGEAVFATLADHLERAGIRGQERKFRERV
jgi:glycosyltransferase involved in cell wall biosynthesis